MTAPERINTLKLIEKQLPEGTKALDGTALRFCFVSACDGAEYAPMDAVTHDIELLKAQHAQAFSAGYEAGEKDHQAALDRIAELEDALEELACRHVTSKPLWWQAIARTALAKGDG